MTSLVPPTEARADSGIAPSAEPSKTEKEKAHEYTGFVGTDIQYGTDNKSGKPVAWFKFGYKTEDGRTSYYKVRTTGRTVGQIRDKFNKGEPVKLRAYKQPWFSQAKDGTTVTETRLHAVYVGSLKPKNTGG